MNFIEYVYSYGWNRFNMGAIGIWPEHNENALRKNHAWFSALWIFTIIWMPQFATVSVFWGNLFETIEVLSTNLPVAVSIMKLLIFRYNRKVLKELLRLAENDWAFPWTKEQEEIMMKPAQISRVISRLSVAVTTGLLVAFTSSQAWIGFQALNHPDPDADPRLSMGLFPSVFPYDTKNLENFVPTWLGQFVGTWLSMIAYSGPDAFLAMIILHVCGQLAVVRLDLKNIVDEECVKNPQAFRRKLSDIIKRHEELNRRSEMIEAAFNPMLLGQMLVCTLTFCFQGFSMLTVVTDHKAGEFPYIAMIFFIVHGIHTTSHLFVYCWVGDVLIAESSDIGFSPYESDWYLMPPAEVKSLMFITHRSRTRLEITAGKFCSFSLELFTGIMKTSMGYLSVLLAMKD